jgi:hypothetical protein
MPNFVDDGFDHYGRLELGHVLEGIRGRRGVDFDQVYKPRTVGEKDPTQSFRYPPALAECVVRTVRKLDHMYLYTSDFHIDWTTKGLMYVAAREPELRPLISPAILKAQDDAEQNDIDRMGALIKDCETRLAMAEGAEHRERIRTRLVEALETCKARGYRKKAEEIRRILGDLIAWEK